MNYTFDLNDTEVTENELFENTTYLYRAIIEGTDGTIYQNVKWNKVTTQDCQQIGTKICFCQNVEFKSDSIFYELNKII